MSENGKFPDYAGIWDSASRARDIHLALMFELATTAFVGGWQALRPHIPSGQQDQSCDPETEGTADPNKADAL